MKVENSKMVSVHYTLTVDGAIADQSREGQPLQFICGAGMLLPKFEGAIIGKEPGDKVSFTLAPADGYGEIIPEAVVDLPLSIFMIDGKIAEEILFEGNIVPMSDAEGHRMNGIIKEVKEYPYKMTFKVAANNLGEGVNTIILTAPAGCKWTADGSNVYRYTPGHKINAGEVIGFYFDYLKLLMICLPQYYLHQ